MFTIYKFKQDVISKLLLYKSIKHIPFRIQILKNTYMNLIRAQNL